MKKTIFKTLVIVCLSFFSFSKANAQMTACTPTALDPFPCGTACMEITIVNVDVPCGLSLYWGYFNCSQLIGYNTPINMGDSIIKTGPCARCNDQLPCECPNKIMLMDQTNTLFWPWGNLTSMSNSLYSNVQNIYGACAGVNVQIIITGTNSATIKFSCI